jgi:hypothetical protein
MHPVCRYFSVMIDLGRFPWPHWLDKHFCLYINGRPVWQSGQWKAPLVNPKFSPGHNTHGGNDSYGGSEELQYREVKTCQRDEKI